MSTEKDYEALKSAARKGDTDAAVAVGMAYFTGRGLPKDQAEAVSWFRRAAIRGNAYAQVLLASCYMRGTGTEADPNQAMIWYRNAALLGDPVAQYQIGRAYALGENGLMKDEARGASWLRSSAEQGHPGGQLYYALCLKNGTGTRKNEEEAVRLLNQVLSNSRADADQRAEAQQYLDIIHHGLAAQSDRPVTMEGYAAPPQAPSAPEKKPAPPQTEPEIDYEDLRSYARSGDPVAQYQIGRAYARGENGLMKDEARGASWLRDSAKQGHPGGQLYYALCLKNGTGTRKNEEEAVRLLNQVLSNSRADADQRAEAQQYLDIIHHGLAAQPDRPVTMEGYAAPPQEPSAPEKKPAPPQTEPVQKSAPVPPQAEKKSAAPPQTPSAAEKKPAPPQTEPPQKSVPVPPQAEKKSAAPQKAKAPAQPEPGDGSSVWRTADDLYGLGKKFERGEGGTEPDAQKALDYYRLAADQGHARAMYRMGTLLYNGVGGTPDRAQAFAWYQSAAEQGDPDAQLALADGLVFGDAGRTDAAEAAEWYSRAAANDSIRAARFMGDCCMNGDGVPKDVKQAVAWYRQAAEGGDRIAMLRLSDCYRRGCGTVKNKSLADIWLKQAAV